MNSRSRKLMSLGWVVLFLAGTLPGLAQLPTGTILGVVRDTSGAVVPGAALTARNVETGQTRTTVAGSDGSYRFSALPVGPYEVRVEQPGFQTEVRTGLTLTVSQEAVVNIALHVGAVQEMVSVTAEAPLVNTTSAELGAIVGEQTIAELPLNGRNYNDLSLLQVGVTENLNRAGGGGSTNGTTWSANGIPIRSNLFLLDGAPENPLNSVGVSSSVGTSLGVEGIREFKVLTSNLSAEYGLAMGATVTLVSKSGTNNYHGSLYEYLRNSVLDARNFFDYKTAFNPSRLPAFKRNQFGGSVGGPLKKDKTFVFGVYEGLRERLGVTKSSSTLPAGCKGPLGTLITNTACPLLGSTAQVRIGSVSPDVARLVNLYPDPNVGNQDAFSATQPTNEHYFQIRVDHNFSSADTFFIRYTFDNVQRTQVNNFIDVPSNVTSQAQFGTLSETHVFSPAALNNLRLSASRTAPFATDSASTVAKFGTPQYMFSPPFPFGSITVGGLTIYQTTTSTKRYQNIFTLSDDVFYTRGRHSLKLGTLLNYFQFGTGAAATANKGTVNFSSVANFLQGIAQTIGGSVPGSDVNRLWTYKTYGFYAQDDFRLNPRLTLNLGLRYEFMTTISDRLKRQSALVNPLTDSAMTIGKTIRNQSFKNFGPRLGFAWDVFGNQRTSVRGGFAILYDLIDLGNAADTAGATDPPFSTTFSFANPASFTIPFIIPANAGVVGTPGGFGYDWKQARTNQYNLTIEQQLPWGMGLSVGYAGTRSYNILAQYEHNPVPVTTMINGNPFRAPLPSASCLTVVPTCRVNPNWRSILFFSPQSNSWYDGLQLGLTRRLAHGLEFQSSYTFSKVLDEVQGLGSDVAVGSLYIADPNNPGRDHGPASFDQTHNFRFNWLYHLPGLQSDHPVAGVLRGWWLGNIISYGTGFPFGPALSTNRSRTGVNNGVGGTGGGFDRPDVVPGVDLKQVTHGVSRGCLGVPAGTPVGTPTFYFDPCAFQLGPQGFLGNLGRDGLRGPNRFSVDLSLNKDTRLKWLGEQGTLQFRLEVFNLFNRANFRLPTDNLFQGAATGSGQIEAPLPNVGVIGSTATTSRQLQLALRIGF